MTEISQNLLPSDGYRVVHNADTILTSCRGRSNILIEFLIIITNENFYLTLY